MTTKILWFKKIILVFPKGEKKKEKAELYSDVYNMFFTSAFEMH